MPHRFYTDMTISSDKADINDIGWKTRIYGIICWRKKDRNY